MSNPSEGTGSGGDRCSEAVSAMIDATNKLGPWAQDGKHTVEQIMYSLVGVFPGNAPGATVSKLENFGTAFSAWLAKNGYDKTLSLSNVHNPSYQDIVACIDAQNVAVGGFNDYVSLRLADGQNPYKWNDPHGLGHVLLIVGYDTASEIVIVHDPLRADPSGQPADYSWAGFQAAQFSDCTRIVGPKLPYTAISGAPTLASSGGDSLALVQHPTQEMRLDLLYVGTDGNLWHNWTTGGMQDLTANAPKEDESWGNPGAPLAPLSVGATWDAQGQYLNVVAATTDGALWGTVHALDGSITVAWTKITGQSVLLPTGAPTGEPVAQSLKLALTNAAKTLESALT